MDFRLITRVLSIVILIEAFSMVPALSVSLIYNEHSTAGAFLFSIVLMLLLSIAGIYFVKPLSKSVNIREGLLIVASSWILASLLSVLPYMLSGSIQGFADAFFESSSGFTTTGASILSNVESLPRGILFWRSFTHWLGGMGILVFAIALLPSLGIGALHIAEAETPGPTTDKLTPKLTSSTRILYYIYIGMTTAEVILLLLGGMNVFDAFIHTFGSVGTGGFSSYSDSIAHFNSLYIEIVITVFTLMAGINFNLYYFLFFRNWRDFVKDRELRAYLLIILFSAVLIAVILYYFGIAERFGTALRLAFFQTVTIITTTGYSTTDFNLWPSSSVMILLLLMFVGGCSSSTSGSIKVIRIVVLFKLIRRGIYKRLHPTAVVPVKLNGKNLSSGVVSSIASFLFLYIIIFMVGTLIVSIENVDLITAASTVAACLGNVGPGFGEVGPLSSYSLYSDATTVFLSLLMITGRLELFTILLLFMPGFWDTNR